MHEIYEKYSKAVYNYLFSLTNNEEISKDLMQETFYIAIKNINSFKGECSIKTWLYKIAQNKWKDYLKKVKNKKFVFYEEKIQEIEKALYEYSDETDIQDKQDIINLYKHIHMLNEETKEVIYLRLSSNLSFRDIGEILCKSENWARITFHRGKIKLREELENEKQ